MLAITPNHDTRQDTSGTRNDEDQAKGDRLSAAEAWINSVVAAGFNVHLQEHTSLLFKPYDQVVLSCMKNDAEDGPLPVFSGWYSSDVALEVREVLKGLGWFSREHDRRFWPDMKCPGQLRSEQQMRADLEWHAAAKSYPDVIDLVSCENRPPHVLLGGKIRYLNAAFEIDQAIAFAVPDYSTPEKRMTAARQWLDEAIAAGHHPKLDYRLEQGKRPYISLWLEISDDNPNPKPDRLPRQIYDEAFAICKELGAVRFSHFGEMPWKSDFMRGDYSGSAFGERLKFVRKALCLDLEAFYEPAGITLETALRWEAGKRPLKRAYPWNKYAGAWRLTFGIYPYWLAIGEAEKAHSKSFSPEVESEEMKAAA